MPEEIEQELKSEDSKMLIESLEKISNEIKQEKSIPHIG